MKIQNQFIIIKRFYDIYITTMKLKSQIKNGDVLFQKGNNNSKLKIKDQEKYFKRYKNNKN